jgi:tetratricopeptide (TPR) repeat protein
MNYFNKVNAWFFGFVFFFLPVFLFVFPGGAFPAIRLFVFFVLASIAFLLWGVKNFLNKNVVILKGAHNFPLFLLFVLLLVSLFMLPTPGATNDSLLGTGGLFLLFLSMFFALINLGSISVSSRAILGLMASVVVLALLILFSFLSLINKIIPAGIFNEKVFISGENFYYLVLFFLTILGLSLVKMLKEKKKIVPFIMAGFAVLGIVVLLINFLMVGNSATFLPFSAGWSATIEIFKNFRSMLIGVGFNQFALYSPLLKTPELMTDRFIFMRFPQTTNAFFELINSLGVLGLFVFGFLFYKLFVVLKDFSKANKNYFELMLQLVPFLVIVISFFFLPFTGITICLFFMSLSMFVWEAQSAKADGFEEAKIKIIREGEGFLSFQTGGMMEKYQYAPKIFAGLVVFFIVLNFYLFFAYPLLSEMHFARYLQAIAQNKGTQAYEEMNAATSANPKNDYYMVELSRVNFQLALSLNAQKNLKDQDKQNISVLVNQSVAAARGATNINSAKLSNWENLAYIYQQLITTDSAAANLAAQAFVQAVNLDPQDPALRVRFAQMLYAAKAYRDAVNQLNAAISMKSDFANAYYNLGLNYKALNELENAKLALVTAQKFVEKGSNDEKILEQEIKSLSEETVEEVKKADVEPTNKITTPAESPEIKNLNKDTLKIQPASASGTPTP